VYCDHASSHAGPPPPPQEQAYALELVIPSMTAMRIRARMTNASTIRETLHNSNLFQVRP
jgi:hypothetical protein